MNNRSPECFGLAFDRPSVAGPTVVAFNGNVERNSLSQNVVASTSEEYSSTTLKGKGKGKVNPRTGLEARDGRLEL